jgi:hypothetical protein
VLKRTDPHGAQTQTFICRLDDVFDEPATAYHELLADAARLERGDEPDPLCSGHQFMDADLRPRRGRSDGTRPSSVGPTRHPNRARERSPLFRHHVPIPPRHEVTDVRTDGGGALDAAVLARREGLADTGGRRGSRGIVLVILAGHCHSHRSGISTQHARTPASSRDLGQDEAAAGTGRRLRPVPRASARTADAKPPRRPRPRQPTRQS